ncbi:type II toxin-antitoxin system Phd/YefM family antitoxin [Magnetospirillum sp. UT-4]|uniref:type II toxin-antitoxin system Phd/YefM family antitoxin n=1 Tax=Magnetospirillum sp. UT-4 TaxID=2681467 RepID=UPI00138061C3|nr:type II toxin-antitoxin system prevent-host-death family antitoxin [Magnetospirillum sp. UT-4]CAA7618616.1 putative Antitoxin [Magnetospirillum sp. UT-4]
MTARISIAQAKAEFAALVSRAEAGEDIVLTRNGRPVARLTHLPADPVAYGDLAGLRLDEDLSLPGEVLVAFERDE